MKNKMLEVSQSPIGLVCDIAIKDIESITPAKAGNWADGEVYDVHLGSGKCFKVCEEDYKKIKTHFDII